jgi:hypothetical protein
MARKEKYQPHPRLLTKRSDSTAGDYNRNQNARMIEEQLYDGTTNTFGGDTGNDADYEPSYNEMQEQEMYERGFHFEMED